MKQRYCPTICRAAHTLGWESALSQSSSSLRSKAVRQTRPPAQHST